MGELPKNQPIAIIRRPDGSETFVTGSVEVPLDDDGRPDLSRVLFTADQGLPEKFELVGILNPDVSEL